MRALVAVQRGNPGAAAAIYDSALRNATDTVPVMAGLPSTSVPAGILAGGGRLATAKRWSEALFRLIPVDTGNGPGGVRMSRAEMRSLTDGYGMAEVGHDGAAASERAMRALIERAAAGDSAQLRQLTNAFGSSTLSAFLASRDTTMLRVFLARADTSTSSTWRVADAQLALARGDTARARMRVERHYRQPAEFEFTGEAGLMRAYAWADLLSRLGDDRAALEAYARLDSASERIEHPGYLARSYAERGAILQRLGERERAIEYYERFIDAWRHADPDLQPLVDRARSAVDALRRGAQPVTPRRPG
jgi:hypothetical protein